MHDSGWAALLAGPAKDDDLRAREIERLLQEQETKAQSEPPPSPSPEPPPPATDSAAPAPTPLLSRRASIKDEWLAGVGITDRSERDQELGAGKWTEPARTLEEVQASMSSEPIREMEVTNTGLPWRRIALVILLAAFLAWLLQGRDSGDSAGPQPTPGEAAGTSSEPTPADGELSSVSAAAADAPEVTVWTDLEGARVELDGRDQGLAPARVPVPLDGRVHQLCLRLATLSKCRELTGEELALQDPYAFILGDGSSP